MEKKQTPSFLNNFDTKSSPTHERTYLDPIMYIHESVVVRLTGWLVVVFTIYKPFSGGGARGIMVIVVGNGHGDTSSNPGRD